MSRVGKRVVLMDDPDCSRERGGMEFRLTYQGLVYPSGNKKTRPDHKHDIRKKLHPQLRRWWEKSPQMNYDPLGKMIYWDGSLNTHTVACLSDRFNICEYNFVPLVTEELSVYCELDILFLRADQVASVVKSSGDIDGKIKTILDALRYPRDKGEFGNYVEPDDDQRPFFCLLQDDRLISKLSVETDLLLQPTGESEQLHDSRVVITVRIHPITLTLENMRFGYMPA